MNKVQFAMGVTLILWLMALNSAVCWCVIELKAIRLELQEANAKR